MNKILIEKIQTELQKRHWNYHDLSTNSGVSHSEISKILSGNREPKESTLTKITKVLNISFNETPLYNNQPQNGAVEFTSVSVIGCIPCGHPETKEQQDLGQVKIAREVLKTVSDIKNVHALIARGDSLKPEAQDSDYLIVDFDKSAPLIEGDLYYLTINHEDIVRHVFRVNGSYRLVAANREYKDLVSKEVDIKGHIVWIQPEGHKPRRL